MSLDQVFFALCDRKELATRSRTVVPLAVAPATGDGRIAGRAADGTRIMGRVTGKSVARRLMEAEGKV